MGIIPTLDYYVNTAVTAIAPTYCSSGLLLYLFSGVDYFLRLPKVSARARSQKIHKIIFQKGIDFFKKMSYNIYTKEREVSEWNAKSTSIWMER